MTDDLGDGAGTSQTAEEAKDKETEEQEEEEMTVDTAATASDETDSEQMEIDSRAGEKSKESDVDAMDSESLKSDNHQTGTIVEKGEKCVISISCSQCKILTSKKLVKSSPSLELHVHFYQTWP